MTRRRIKLPHIYHRPCAKHDPRGIHKINHAIGVKISVNLRWRRTDDPIKHPSRCGRLNKIDRVAVRNTKFLIVDNGIVGSGNSRNTSRLGKGRSAGCNIGHLNRPTGLRHGNR